MPNLLFRTSPKGLSVRKSQGDMAQQHKSTIAMKLLVLFLAFSCLLSSLAVPSTRSLLSSSGEDDDDKVSSPDLLAQDEIMGTSEGEEMVSKKRRVEMKSDDYPGTEAKGGEMVSKKRRMEMKSNDYPGSEAKGGEMVSEKRRMIDYPGTEANNHHNPRTPGTA